jgi:hypothetical protein
MRASRAVRRGGLIRSRLRATPAGRRPGPARAALLGPANAILLGMALSLLIPGVAGAADPPPVGDAPTTHVLIVAGLGGEERFRRTFLEWGLAMREAALDAGVPPGAVRLLTEDPGADPERIGGRSTREEVERAFAEIAADAGPSDRVLLLLIGHGSGSGAESRLSLPGPSLTAADYGRLLDALPTRSVAVVNAASASGDFIPVLAAEGRVVITATRSASQRNATVFGGHFVAAFAHGAADLDRDGRVSLLEAFEYARRETERHYRDRGLVESERALLAEGPGGRGVARPLEEEGMGTLARAFVLEGGTAAVAGVTDPEAAARLRELHAERDRLEARMAALAADRGSMDPEAYEAALEAVLLELARVGREIRAIEEGGGP